MPSIPSDITALHQDIIHCHQCPRLRAWCQQVAEEKVKRFQEDTYWGRPVPSFGDPLAALLIVGLAPAAHGANRTGRMFTGDRSGEWLYRALHRAGYANQSTYERPDDGLILTQAYITAVAHCAPPENKPSREEIAACRPFLIRELQAMETVRVIVALGSLAFAAVLQESDPETRLRPKPKFGHGAEVALPNGRILIGSYHPSQQNTFTGKLTEPMFDGIFNRCNTLLGLPSLALSDKH
jgi:uracil-DNA glycosylase family 4